MIDMDTIFHFAMAPILLGRRGWRNLFPVRHIYSPSTPEISDRRTLRMRR
jgi:hypothetical protein